MIGSSGYIVGHRFSQRKLSQTEIYRFQNHKKEETNVSSSDLYFDRIPADNLLDF